MFITNDSSKQSDEIQAIEANDMKMVFYSPVNQTHFHKKRLIIFSHEPEFPVTQPFYIIVVQGRSGCTEKQKMKGFLLRIT